MLSADFCWFLICCITIDEKNFSKLVGCAKEASTKLFQKLCEVLDWQDPHMVSLLVNADAFRSELCDTIRILLQEHKMKKLRGSKNASSPQLNPMVRFYLHVLSRDTDVSIFEYQYLQDMKNRLEQVGYYVI